MESNARLMLHGGFMFMPAYCDDLQMAGEWLDRKNAEVASLLAARTGRCAAFELARLNEHADWWMTPVEALAQGYIDAIVPANAP